MSRGERKFAHYRQYRSFVEPVEVSGSADNTLGTGYLSLEEETGRMKLGIHVTRVIVLFGALLGEVRTNVPHAGRFLRFLESNPDGMGPPNEISSGQKGLANFNLQLTWEELLKLS